MSDARPRGWSVQVRGFDFQRVRVRARSREQARMIVARAFEEAGFGDIKAGLQHVVSVRVDPSADGLRLVGSERHDGVGLLAEDET